MWRVEGQPEKNIFQEKKERWNGEMKEKKKRKEKRVGSRSNDEREVLPSFYFLPQLFGSGFLSLPV